MDLFSWMTETSDCDASVQEHSSRDRLHLGQEIGFPPQYCGSSSQSKITSIFISFHIFSSVLPMDAEMIRRLAPDTGFVNCAQHHDRGNLLTARLAQSELPLVVKEGVHWVISMLGREFTRPMLYFPLTYWSRWQPSRQDYRRVAVGR